MGLTISCRARWTSDQECEIPSTAATATKMISRARSCILIISNGRHRRATGIVPRERCRSTGRMESRQNTESRIRQHSATSSHGVCACMPQSACASTLCDEGGALCIKAIKKREHSPLLVLNRRHVIQTNVIGASTVHVLTNTHDRK